MGSLLYRQLLIGCGIKRDRRIDPRQFPWTAPYPISSNWDGLLETLDYNEAARPDFLWNLEHTPWGRCILHNDGTRELEGEIADDTYDEVHAYEVLEHLGSQGNVVDFFAHFSEIWRILKPGGFLCATVPSRYSQWLWGDPGHTRAILPGSLVFLSQAEYAAQVGKTAMSDYRGLYTADFDIVGSVDDQRETHSFVLKAIKPSRWPVDATES